MQTSLMQTYLPIFSHSQSCLKPRGTTVGPYSYGGHCLGVYPRGPNYKTIICFQANSVTHYIAVINSKLDSWCNSIYSQFFPRTFTVLCGIFTKHITNVCSHRGAFNGFLTMSLLRSEACVSLVMHCGSLDAEIKSTDQSKRLSHTLRRNHL